MTQVKMPEPVMRICAEGAIRAVTEWRDGARDLPDGDHDLITTTQAEVYAAAKVREAMSAAYEKAAQRSMSMPHYSDFERGYAEGRSHAAMEIREFIPGPVEP